MIILGSKSKARYQLLRMYNAEIKVIVPDIDETFDDNLNLEDNIKLVAYKKAQNILSNYNLENNIIICADTIVVLDNEILLKPNSYQDAFEMIKKLSNKTIKVLTGVYLEFCNNVFNFCEESTISFPTISDEVIEEYLENTNNYLEISGALDIDKIKNYIDYTYTGSYTNIIGLPMEKISSILYDDNEKNIEYSSPELDNITIFRSSVRNLILEEDKVYLLKGYTFDKKHTYYTSVGGGYHFFEDKLDVIKKETIEESGLIVDELKQIINITEYTSLNGYISYNKLTHHSYFISKVIDITSHNYIEYEVDLLIGVETFYIDQAINLLKEQYDYFKDLNYPIKVISECDLKALEKAKYIINNDNNE